MDQAWPLPNCKIDVGRHEILTITHVPLKTNPSISEEKSKEILKSEPKSEILSSETQPDSQPKVENDPSEKSNEILDKVTQEKSEPQEEIQNCDENLPKEEIRYADQFIIRYQKSSLNEKSDTENVTSEPNQ